MTKVPLAKKTAGIALDTMKMTIKLCSKRKLAGDKDRCRGCSRELSPDLEICGRPGRRHVTVRLDTLGTLGLFCVDELGRPSTQ